MIQQILLNGNVLMPDVRLMELAISVLDMPKCSGVPPVQFWD